jgi:hypothetical protein
MKKRKVIDSRYKDAAEPLDPLAEALMRSDKEDTGSDHYIGLGLEPIHWQLLVANKSVNQRQYAPQPFATTWINSKIKPFMQRGVKTKMTRYPDGKSFVRQEVSDSTLGWNEKGQFLFLFLKDIIPQELQAHALTGLRWMRFVSTDKSNRTELKKANEFNRTKKGNETRAGELNFGYGERGRIFETTATQRQRIQYGYVGPLLKALDNTFARSLPMMYRAANLKIPPEFRAAGITTFSSIAMLKSAPSAVHRDSGNGNTLACMTSVAGATPYSGGAFCFLEYGVQIAVRPGDVLIATTPRDWHCNLTPVVGEKYSIVAYFRRSLANEKMLSAHRAKLAKKGRS